MTMRQQRPIPPNPRGRDDVGAIRKFLAPLDSGLTDEEVKRLYLEMRQIAEILLDFWIYKQQKKRNRKKK